MSTDEIEDRLQRIEHLLTARAGQAGHIPKQAHWTYKEFRIRLSLGINPHALSDAELVEWLSDSRVMSRKSMYRLFNDEACPIRPLKLPGGHRVSEVHVRQYLDMEAHDSRPRSLSQI